jgi:parallel beta-helix repeat protein
MDAHTLSRVVPLLVASLCLSAPNARAATYVVRPDGSGQFPTIQAAINACAHGDTVELTDGTFRGHGNRDISYLGRAITVRSQSGDPYACIIDCEANELNPHRGFHFHSGETAEAVVEGVRITGGFAAAGEIQGGGGIACFTLSSPTIRNCVIDYCNATHGGGILCQQEASPTITDCMISHCDAWTISGTTGAGIFVGFGSSPEISDCTIVNNEAHGNCNGKGGGIGVSRSRATINRCTIAGNFVDNGGGGIYVAGAGSDVTITECTITGNRMDVCHYWWGGGGVWAEVDNPSVVIRSSTISGNFSNYFAGGVGCENATVVIERSIIWGNCATEEGDEVYVDGNLSFACSAVDSAKIEGPVSCTWIGGNVFDDPAFCDPLPCEDAPTTEGDYRLHAASPCAPDNSPVGCGLIGALPVGCGVTAVASDEAPSRWIGLRVHPNPIRTSGVVEWMSDGVAATALKLYDPRGRLVLAREMDDRESGWQQVRWGDLVGNRRLLPGIYFLELGGLSGQRQAARVIVIR